MNGNVKEWPVVLLVKEKGRYRVIGGFRRYEAAIALGSKTIRGRVITEDGVHDIDIMLIDEVPS